MSACRPACPGIMPRPGSCSRVMLLVLVLAACGGTAAGRLVRTFSSQPHRSRREAPAADAGASRLGRRLMQGLLNYAPIRIQGITMFANSPAAATSATVGQDAKAVIGPEGTLQLGGGLSFSQGVALSKRALNPRTDTRLQNRPQAFTAAYVTTPLSLGWTFFPTIGSSFSEAQGDLFSATNGFYIIDEFGYNAITNNLGNSLSLGQSGALNLGGADTLRLVGDGLSGNEMIGTANANVDLADARAAQTGQAIAYPFNLLLLANPLTCTQLFLTASTVANYDLGAQPLPFLRRNPPQIVPFCAEFFNTATLDDFIVLLTEVPDIFDLNFLFGDELDTSDDLLRKAGIDIGDNSLEVPTAGRFSLSGPAADQALVTPLELLKAGNQSAPAASSSSTNTTLTGSSNATAAAQQGDELYQLLADLSGSFDSRANATLEALLQSRLGANSSTLLSGGGNTTAAAAGAAGVDGLSPRVAGLSGPAGSGSGAAAGPQQPAGGVQGEQQAVLPARQGTGSSLDAAVTLPQEGAATRQAGEQPQPQQQQKQQQEKGPLVGLLDAITQSPIAKLLQREVQRLPSSRLAAGSAAILRNLTASSAAEVANKTAEVRKQAFGLAGQVAYNASDLGIRSVVQVVDAADPLLELRYNASQGLYRQLVNASSSVVDAAVGLLAGEAAARGGDLAGAVAAAAAAAEEAAGAAGDDAAAGGGGGGGDAAGQLMLEGSNPGGEILLVQEP